MSGILSKFLYPDVIVRTSIIPALLGAFVAYYSGVAILNYISYIVWLVVVIGIIVVQGIIEHGMDILHDKGGYSAFRVALQKEMEKGNKDIVKRINKMIKIAYIICGILSVIIIVCGRYWLLLIGVMAVMSAKLYVKTHNEWYSTFGFMLSFSVGYFAFTNYLTSGWFIGAMIVGFVMKPSQAMYRLDDYLNGEFDNNLQIIQYYRNIFRNTLHMVGLLIVALLLYIDSNIGQLLLSNCIDIWMIISIYAICIMLMGMQFFSLKASKTHQEMNLAPLIFGIIASELYAVFINNDIDTIILKKQNYDIIKYYISVILYILIFTRFWIKRHGMCNMVKKCGYNTLRNVKTPK